jgi:hypothetical protein
MTGVASSLTAHGIPTIPIHDSVRVPVGYIGKAEAKMQDFLGAQRQRFLIGNP